MIRTLTACTAEIDDVETAVSEILSQLEPDKNLLKNTVGLLSCYSDFVSSEAVKEICGALPFEVIGSTTLANAVPGSSSAMLLTLMVLTSDDVSFSAGLSEPLLSQDGSVLADAYEAALGKLSNPETNSGAKPALMISFAPLLLNISGDFLVDTFSKISGGLPNFGTIAVDNNVDYREAFVIHNGEAYRDRYAFVLLAGGVQPRFFTASLSTEKIFDAKGVVTASSGNQLQTVNNIPVADYLQTLGLARDGDGSIVGINTFPFIMDYNDGTEPIVRTMFANTPEGYAVCGGDVPAGVTLTVGSIDAKTVIRTTGEVLASALASGKPDGVLMFSCVGRYFVQGYNPTEELETVQALMKESGAPYLFAYSGGELCPVYSQDSKSQDNKLDKKRSVTNRNHNDTFIILFF